MESNVRVSSVMGVLRFLMGWYIRLVFGVDYK